MLCLCHWYCILFRQKLMIQDDHTIYNALTNASDVRSCIPFINPLVQKYFIFFHLFNADDLDEGGHIILNMSFTSLSLEITTHNVAFLIFCAIFINSHDLTTYLLLCKSPDGWAELYKQMAIFDKSTYSSYYLVCNLMNYYFCRDDTIFIARQMLKANIFNVQCLLINDLNSGIIHLLSVTIHLLATSSEILLPCRTSLWRELSTHISSTATEWKQKGLRETIRYSGHRGDPSPHPHLTIPLIKLCLC